MTENRISVIVDRTFDNFHEEIEEIFELTSDACLAYKIGALHEKMRSVLENELTEERDDD